MTLQLLGSCENVDVIGLGEAEVVAEEEEPEDEIPFPV